MTQIVDESFPSARLERYQKFVRRKREEAQKGDFRLSPKGLWLYISENCNFRCIGCYTGPGQFKKSYMSLDEARVLLASESSYSYIDITSGEGLLHPQVCEIIEVCKSIHPLATIELVTNGSIPPRGRIRRAIEMIDGLGLSIDGATKKTFEEIRVGGNFERFLSNVKEFVAVRAETGKPSRLEFCFTALTTNLSELPGVVRIAAELGVPAVFFQPMEMGEPEIKARMGAFDLKLMAREEIFRVTDEAIALGKSLGVDVGGREFMVRGADHAEDGMQEAAAEIGSPQHEEAICTCQTVWTDHFRYVRDGENYLLHLCCQMPVGASKALSRKYGLVFQEMKSVDVVFNSDAYWGLRQGQAEGEISSFCGDCKHASSHTWTEPKEECAPRVNIYEVVEGS